MQRLWVRLSIAIASVIAFIILIPAVGITVVSNLDDHGTEITDSIWWEVPETTFQSLLVIGVLGIAGGIMVSRLIAAPLEELVTATQQIAAGNLNARVTLTGSEEIEALAAHFNTMAGNLQASEQQRKQLMADIAHELRTPLTVLDGNLRAAIDDVYSLQETGLTTLYSQTQHLIRLVTDLQELTLADAQALPITKQPEDLAALLNETADFFSLLATEHAVVLRTVVAPNLPTVALDASRMQQVFHNILANAFQHTPAGGTITIAAQASARNTVVIQIEDTGAGIAAAELPHLFDRFYRVDKSRSRETGGTGLGLAISKAIVDAHAGRITVTSAGLDNGTTFEIELPLNNR